MTRRRVERQGEPPAPGGLKDTDGRGRTDGPLGRWRGAVRSRPGGPLLLKTVAGVIGVAFVALGAALVVLPGPLTIPPVLVGMYVLSLEFVWAERLFDRARESGQKAWASARRKPVTSGLVTGGGLVAAGFAVWAVSHYELVGKAKDAVGL